MQPHVVKIPFAQLASTHQVLFVSIVLLALSHQDQVYLHARFAPLVASQAYLAKCSAHNAVVVK